MPTLSVQSAAVAFGDAPPNSNPRRRYFDWKRDFSVEVASPRTAPFSGLEAGGSRVVFDGARATTVDGTTAFSVALSLLGAPRYRFSWTGGANPTLRVNRSLSLSGVAVTVAVNGDQTATLTVGSGSLAAVQPGDTVYLPGPSTGDAATAFSPLNEGWWAAISVPSSTSVQLQRPSGTPFSASGETVTLGSAAQLQAFSAAGVQPGDRASVEAGFAPSTLRTFTVDRVTPAWFEVLSTSPVPAEVGKVPGASGIFFYTDARAFVRVESDQELGVRLNGSDVDSARVSPWQAGVDAQVGWLELSGPVWRLEVLNRSSVGAEVTVFSAGGA